MPENRLQRTREAYRVHVGDSARVLVRQQSGLRPTLELVPITMTGAGRTYYGYVDADGRWVEGVLPTTLLWPKDDDVCGDVLMFEGERRICVKPKGHRSPCSDGRQLTRTNDAQVP